MTRTVWTTLLEEARSLHARDADVQAFCAFPDASFKAGLEAQADPLCDVMRADAETAQSPFSEFVRACLDAAPHALWRDTYRNTPIGEALHAHFGTFEILGRDTPLQADGMRGFLIYQRPGYHYPLHHHPAEELYLVLSGAGQFEMEGHEPQWLTPGQTAYHPSNIPHALTTKGQSVLAYVLWRGDLATKPVFTYPEALA